MCATGFHVHGSHDHEMEHARQHGTKSRSATVIAVTTAILAAAGALLSCMAGAMQANAVLFNPERS